MHVRLIVSSLTTASGCDKGKQCRDRSRFLHSHARTLPGETQPKRNQCESLERRELGTSKFAYIGAIVDCDFEPSQPTRGPFAAAIIFFGGDALESKVVSNSYISGLRRTRLWGRSMEKQFTIEGGELKFVPKPPKPPISERKLEANRANSLKSTGPKTERGKNTSRYNAAKHGILGKALLLRTPEDRAEFNGLVRLLHEELQPVGGFQILIVEEIAVWQMRKKRLLLYETGRILEYEKAGRDLDEQSGSDVAEHRPLVACLKRARRDVRRCGALARETADELATLVERSDLEQFHTKFARAKVIDAADQHAAGTEPDQGVRSPAREVMRARLAVIAGYLDPLEQECAEADHERVVQIAVTSLPPAYELEKILRYRANVERSIAGNILLLNSLQNRARMAGADLPNEAKN